MKLITSAVFAIVVAAPAFAQAAPAEKVDYVCYYNAAGKLTSAKPAEPGKVAHSTFETTGRGGDQAWIYGVKSTDGTDCPKRVHN